MPERQSKDDLLATHLDPEWRDRLVKIDNLTSFLTHSILRRGYKIPDQMASAVILTAAGNEMLDYLVRKQQVPPKEARILCLLTLAHRDLYVDPTKTNVDSLRESIDRQIQNGDLIHPFVFGRNLYDRASELFEDERRHLTYDETLSLLEGQPQGVFQVGSYTVGPWGLLEVSTPRFLYPTTRVSLYHCPELTCIKIHSTLLSSDMLAPINDHRRKVDAYLEKQGQPSAFGELLTELSGLNAVRYDDETSSALFYAIGDALQEHEIKVLFAWAMDNTSGTFRASLLKGVGLEGKATDVVTNLSRAQMLQLLLYLPEDAVSQALDKLILDDDIVVPHGEVRSAVINRNAGFGTFALTCEISRHGVRTDSLTENIAPLRLRRLVDGLYPLDQPGTEAELEWQLRGVDGESLVARLEEFLRSSSPSTALERLCLARNEVVDATCKRLRLDKDAFETDQDLVDAMLWKLGYSQRQERGVNDDFWLSHTELKNATSTLEVSTLIDKRRIRELSSNYFADLEGVLDDALAYCAWALTSDHLAATAFFNYSPSVNRREAFEVLNGAARKLNFERDEFLLGEKNTLYPLSRGFDLLAMHLESLDQDEVLHRRSDADYPKFASRTVLKRFPFEHRVPFLDLTPSARETICRALREVSRHLANAEVTKVRNDQLHFRRATSDLKALAKCLSEVEMAIRLLEASGLCRILFRLVRRLGDDAGRSLMVLGDSAGREIAFSRPSPYTSLSLPVLDNPQYLLTSAVFAEPNEMLRFSPKYESSYAEIWVDYPRRRVGSMKAGETPIMADDSGGSGNLIAG